MKTIEEFKKDAENYLVSSETVDPGKKVMLKENIIFFIDNAIGDLKKDIEYLESVKRGHRIIIRELEKKIANLEGITPPKV